MFVGGDGRIPVRHILADAAHIESRTAVAPGVGAFLFEFLQSHEPRQQCVVRKIQILELVEAAIGIEVALAVLNEIEYRLIENHYCKLDGFTLRSLMWTRGQPDADNIAWLISLLVALDAHVESLVRIHDRDFEIADAVRGSAKVDAALVERRGARDRCHSWRHHHD